METLKSCVTFEPRKDTGELEKIVERYKSYFGEDPLEVKNENESRVSETSRVS